MRGPGPLRRERQRRFAAIYWTLRAVLLLAPEGITFYEIRSAIHDAGTFGRQAIHDIYKEHVECRILTSDADKTDPTDIRKVAQWMSEAGIEQDSCHEFTTTLTDISNAGVEKRLIARAMERLQSSDKWEPAWGEFIDAAIERQRLKPDQINDYYRRGITIKPSAMLRPFTASNLVVLEFAFEPGRIGPKSTERITKCPYYIRTLTSPNEPDLRGDYSVGLTFGLILYDPVGNTPDSHHRYNVELSCVVTLNAVYHREEASWGTSLSVDGGAVPNSKISDLGNEIVHFLTSVTVQPSLGQCYIQPRHLPAGYPFSLTADLSGLSHVFVDVSYGADTPRTHPYHPHLATVENSADYVLGSWHLIGYVPEVKNGLSADISLTLSSENPFRIAVPFGDQQRTSKFENWSGSFTLRPKLQPCPASAHSEGP